MNHLYNYSLCFTLSLLFFFSGYFILGRTPDKPIFKNYIRSRRVMGSALFLLGVNYTIHMLCNLRFHNPNAAILMNLSTYYMTSWLFSSSLNSLLDKNCLTNISFLKHTIGWIFFTILSGCVLFVFKGGLQLAGLLIMTIWFLVYAFVLARRLIISYKRAVKAFDDTHSDDIGAYIKWLSIFTYWAVIYGVCCGLLTFLPGNLIYLWIISSIPFYVYLYCSYMNYMLFYEQVETILEKELDSDVQDEPALMPENIPSSYSAIAKKLESWTSQDAYIRQGLTIEDVAEAIGTNRTYLAGYIKFAYQLSFREWITWLRIDYAKRLLVERPELTVAGVSEMSGFLSLSNFTKVFSEKENCSPAKWRKTKASISQKGEI